MAQPHLLSIPDELLSTIVDILPLDAILPFALTCTETYRVSKARLESNQEYHAQYKLQHDRKPLTVPSLLRLAIHEPEAIWHMRAFEAWGLRPGWHEWRTWKTYGSNFNLDDDVESVDLDWPEPAEDHSHLNDSFFAPHEMDEFAKLMQQTLFLAPDEVEKWMQRTRDGWDEALKGMLFALAPNLDRLNFIASDTGWGTVNHLHPLKFLRKAVCSLHHRLQEGVSWPAGFTSLRKISVCNSTDLRHPHDAFYVPTAEAAFLFLLPGLETLNLTLIGYGDDGDFDLAEGSSTVTDLAFSCCSISFNSWKKFVLAPKRLRKYTFAHSSGGDDAERNQVLVERHHADLESLALDSYGTEFSYLKRFSKLRVIDRMPEKSLVKGETFFEDLVYRPATTALSDDGQSWDVAVAELRECLPTSLESLGLQGLFYERSPQAVPVWNELLDAVADLVEDERFADLKEVCLFEGGRLGQNADALRRIEAQGVNTHMQYLVNDRQKDVHRTLHRRDGNMGLTGNETDPRLHRSEQRPQPEM